VLMSWILWLGSARVGAAGWRTITLLFGYGSI
jgi:hypothetical protein